MLYWRFQFPRRPDRYKWAIRQGDWKLFTDIDANRNRSGRPARAGDRMLVDLAKDIGEGTDLSGRHGAKVEALEAAWKRWNAELLEPGGEARPTSKRAGRRGTE